ncbi:MAG: hypothetical protein ACI8VT_001824 [Saprospiraceae bacterium]|jgi:hypothetical protein
MGVFDRIFGANDINNNDQPDIRFGRYSDSYKTKEQYDVWDSALEKFDKNDYLGAYMDFFYYLKDEKEDNVNWREEEGVLHFEILQGSRKITGLVDHSKIRVEAKIAKVNHLHVNFLNRLISQNFDLEYSRFALDKDNCIVIVFDSFLLDGSPYKFYYAIRELAINADKQDDLLLDEFEGLTPIEIEHRIDFSEAEKEVKYQFIKAKIQETFEIVDSGSLNVNQYPGGITYLLLDLVYRLDFLIKPEGFMMETLERINRLYFSNDKKTTQEKNVMIRKELKSLIDRPKAEFFKEMYRVRTTFGITKPINLQRIRGIIEGELPHMDWYKENDHQSIAKAIPGYIVGNCLFNYAVPKVVLDLFKMYFMVMEPDYFDQLGFKNQYFDSESDKFSARKIKKEIRDIVQANKQLYYALHPDIGLLKFTSKLDFAKSFLIMIKEMELTSVDG